MPALNQQKAWIDGFRPACRARKMRFVLGEGFVVDDVYITSVRAGAFYPPTDPDVLRISWTCEIKPMAVDEILWAAFLPDVVMGLQMKINRRINGSFQVQPLQFHKSSVDVAPDAAPNWGPVLDDFDRARAKFIAAHPDPASFVTALEQDSSPLAPSRVATRMVTALIAADRGDDAAQVAEEATARGEGGGMSSTVDVLKYLAAYAKGPAAYDEFTHSLIPTHDYQVIGESRSGAATGLCREHHRGSMSRVLAEMDGRDPWAIVLAARPRVGQPDDASTSLYLQAAGTAEAMVIEFCQPQDGGSVRAVLSHPHTEADERDVEIVLPHSIQLVSRHEVFASDEAIGLFETFYRTNTIPDGYVLRPVERYTVDGGPVAIDD